MDSVADHGLRASVGLARHPRVDRLHRGHLARAAVGQPGAGDVDPVQEVVGQQHVRHVVERRAGQRRQRLVVQVRDADDSPMAPSRSSRVAARHGRRPAPVVVDRDADAGGVGPREHGGQPGQVVGRQGERLLGQHVLAGVDRRLDPVQPALGTGGEVDVAHLGVGQQLLGAGVDPADEREPLAHLGGGLRAAGSRRRSRRRRTARRRAGAPTARWCRSRGSRRRRGRRGSGARCRGSRGPPGRGEPQHGLQDLGVAAVEALEDRRDVGGVHDVGDEGARRRPGRGVPGP